MKPTFLRDDYFGRKNYGSIGHMPGSKMIDRKDVGLSQKQASIITEKPRYRKDWKDKIYALEKLDGSNCGVVRVDNDVVAITRAGFLCKDSDRHHYVEFHEYVTKNKGRFLDVLDNGQRLVIENLIWAHGIKYKLQHEGIVVLDIMCDNKRLPFNETINRCSGLFVLPKILYEGHAPITVSQALELLGDYGHHGAQELAEGVVFRVEADSREKGHFVDFLGKYVRPEMKCGQYLAKSGPLFKNEIVIDP